jgi:hypothetical protein
VTWTFIDYQEYYGGENDEYQIPGETYTYTTTEGDESAQLGLNISNTQNNSGVTGGNYQIGMGGWWSYDTLAASGTLSHMDDFIGTGMVNVSILPFLEASWPVVDGSDTVEAALIYVQDSATLTVAYTYTDPAPVPEPRWMVLALAIGVLALRGCKAIGNDATMVRQLDDGAGRYTTAGGAHGESQRLERIAH